MHSPATQIYLGKIEVILGTYIPVLAEADFMSKCFVAQFASIRPFAIVRTSGMHFKSMRRRENLFTFHA